MSGNTLYPQTHLGSKHTHGLFRSHSTARASEMALLSVGGMRGYTPRTEVGVVVETGEYLPKNSLTQQRRIWGINI